MRDSNDLQFLHYAHFPQRHGGEDKYYDGYCSLKFMSKGSVVVSYDKEEYHLTGTWFWPSFPGPRIKMRAADGHDSWDHRYVAMTGPLMFRWLAEGLFPRRPQEGIYSDNTHEREFDMLLEKIESNALWSGRQAVNLLERILLDLAQAHHQALAEKPWVERISDYCESGNVFFPDYDKLAGQFHTSVRTLRARFKQETGMTLHTFIIQRRVGAARRLLAETDQPLKQIAHSLGYADIFFFVKQFKAHGGITPSTYRRYVRDTQDDVTDR